MESILDAAISAGGILFTPLRMGFLVLGVFLGLVIGIIPGLGGIVGLSLLLPFTFNLDPYSAMAVLMGMAAAVSHGDVIPAILFGVPGTVGCAATVIDGYPMTKRGEAGRALGAAFNASLLGGIFGALLLAVIVPVISPVVLLFGSPEMLAICIFGITLVASLSGNAPLKGLMAALIGLLLSMCGQDAQTSTLRFTFDSLYLWNGIPIVPVALGVFAVPELCDIMINRKTVHTSGKIDTKSGQWQGWKDAFSSWFLVLRSSTIGACAAIIPGLGAPVVDWLGYGHALKTEKGASETFGKGDVRGIIAAEASTNAREGGSLVTTIAFGVPGHASMAILLGAFLIQGIVPGPNMLTKHLDLTYTIIWSLALANVIGTVVCFLFANQFALVAVIRYTLLLPVMTVLVNIGAFEGEHSWGDIAVLIGLGTVAWMMKKCGWPRPPLVLGFILGKLIERYLFISVERYDWSWLGNWFVLLMFGLSALGLLQRLISQLRAGRAGKIRISFGPPVLSLNAGLALAVFIAFVITIFIEARWDFEARLVPLIVSAAGIIFGLLLVVSELFLNRAAASATSGAPLASMEQGAMDLHMGYGDVPEREVYRRALSYFLWLYGLTATGLVIGFLPALVLFAFAFARFHGRESWIVSLGLSIGLFVFLWLVFDYFAHIPWPQSLLGEHFPALRSKFGWF